VSKIFKILIIDDSQTIRKTADVFLKSAGYEVIAEENGFNGLTTIIEETPDLVFMDVVMDGIDGLETCQVIRENDEFKNMPIIILSSKDGEFDKARGLMMGANDYLIKPFKKNEIIEMAQKWLKNN
jgi:twitching motility two-component system response regulator PilG